MKTKRTKKVATVEGLAGLMQREFSGIHREMRAEFVVLKQEVRELGGRTDRLEKHTLEVLKKLDDFITLYRDTKEELTVLARQIQRLERRVAELEAKHP